MPLRPVASVFALAVTLAFAAGRSTAEENLPVEAPPPPPPVQSGEPLEPEVTIRETDKETVYEYRRNGQLVLVRVQPRVGPPYHFIDVDGDGELDYRPGEPVRDNVNQWILLRW
ncbi:MAG: DUF2782 domain-containing protein [Gammaproteobacteria bacterium]|nr:DUF2782 domain-containing protein [Gammaproteobacteria bacterium]MCB1923077.1 DUF2782 domain-containing protein [Gammaproteobacteria bacterium]